MAAELKALAELRDSGEITQAEYETLRARLIGAPPKWRSGVLAIVLVSVLVLAVAGGVVAVLLLRSGGDSEASPSVAPTAVSSTMAPTTTGERATTTVAAEYTTAPASTTTDMVTTTTDGLTAVERLNAQTRLMGGEARASGFARAMEELHGPLWAPNGLSSAAIVECAAARWDAFTRGGRDNPTNEQQAIHIITLQCAGYSDAEAREMAGAK